MFRGSPIAAVPASIDNAVAANILSRSRESDAYLTVVGIY
jgi:hypothetical protein